jgi:hypothetical protein
MNALVLSPHDDWVGNHWLGVKARSENALGARTTGAGAEESVLGEIPAPATARALVHSRAMSLRRSLTLGMSLALSAVVCLAAEPAGVECQKGTCLDEAKVAHGAVVLKWPNGKKWKEGRLEHGTPQGPWRYHWPNGKKMADIVYVDGLRHGPAEYRYQNGKLQAKGRYAKGRKAVKFEYYAYGGAETQTFPVTLDKAQKNKLIQTARKVRQAALALRQLADQPPPQGLVGRKAEEFAAHSRWIAGAAERVDAAGILGSLLAGKPVTIDSMLASTFRSRLGVSYAALRGVGIPLVSEFSALNMQYLRLQSTLKNESREFEELEGPSAARHGAARKALTSML